MNVRGGSRNPLERWDVAGDVLQPRGAGLRAHSGSRGWLVNGRTAEASKRLRRLPLALRLSLASLSEGSLRSTGVVTIPQGLDELLAEI
jgi:hypothetical protein